MPKMVRARPTATWFARKLTASTENITDSAMAPSIAATTARKRLPVADMVMKATTAPITIMPSTPMLSTPDRSTTSSPSAA